MAYEIEGERGLFILSEISVDIKVALGITLTSNNIKLRGM